VQLGSGVTIVYVIAGAGEDGRSEAARHDGLRAAYTALTGDTAWSCGWIDIAGHAAEHCRLEAAHLSLVFLGYPDGGHDGSAPNSLLRLWENQLDGVTTLGARTATYDRPGLIATVAAIIDATAPLRLRTLEVAATHGGDHSDHMLVGALAVLATAASSQSPLFSSYRGDNTANEIVNVVPAVAARSLDALAHYAACADGCAPCGQACATDQLDPTQLTWLQRSYATPMLRTATGQLRLGTSCVIPGSGGGNPVLAGCTSAPAWQLATDGTLRTASSCLEVLPTGEVVTATCGGNGPTARWLFDSEGHLWSGEPPAPSADEALAHLYCLRDAGGRPRAGLCGAASAPTWSFVPVP
jgi:hypothetical protein